MHIYPKSTHPWLRFHKLNILPGCRRIHDHFHSLGTHGQELMFYALSKEQRTTLEELARQRK